MDILQKHFRRHRIRYASGRSITVYAHIDIYSKLYIDCLLILLFTKVWRIFKSLRITHIKPYLYIIYIVLSNYNQHTLLVQIFDQRFNCSRLDFALKYNNSTWQIKPAKIHISEVEHNKIRLSLLSTYIYWLNILFRPEKPAKIRISEVEHKKDKIYQYCLHILVTYYSCMVEQLILVGNRFNIQVFLPSTDFSFKCLIWIYWFQQEFHEHHWQRNIMYNLLN